MPVMTQREIEKALLVKKDTYPGNTECADCGEIWFAHNGSICPICSVCGHHGLNHSASPGQAIEVIEVRERSDFVWCLCLGGTRTFLPLLDQSAMFEA